MVLTHLACCHTVMIEESTAEVKYNASSPDELALVNAAYFFGYRFIERNHDNVTKIEISLDDGTVITK